MGSNPPHGIISILGKTIETTEITNLTIINEDISDTAGIVTTKLEDSAVFVLTDQTNTFGDFDQTFKDNRILIESPDGLTPVTIVNSQQTLARNLTVPILTGNRNIVATGEANQLTNTELTSGVFGKITGLGAQTQTLDLNGNIVTLDTNQTIVPDAGGLTYNVPTGDDHDFQVNNVSILSISDTLVSQNTGFFARSGTTGITASTIQTQGQGALTTVINEVATVANTSDTVTLPTATPFIDVIIINNGANSLQIFPASGDDLGQGVDTAITLSGGSNIRFFTYNSTNWESV